MTYIKTVEEALGYVQKEVNILREKLNEAFPKPMKIETYYDLTKRPILNHQLTKLNNNGTEQPYSFSSQDLHSRADTTEKVEARLEGLTAALDAIMAEGETIRQANLAAIKHNSAIHARVKLLMEELGVRGYSKIERVRGRDKTISYDPGYFGDLTRAAPVFDGGWTSFKDLVERRKRAMSEWAQNRRAELREAEQFRKEAEKVQKRDLFLATARVRYELPFDATREDVFEAILGANSHLKLGHRLLGIRCNFSYGERRANQALSEFEPEDVTDRELADRVQASIENWDGDGRIFNADYSDAFALAQQKAPQAVTDYETFKELFPDEDDGW